jgi:AraC-like DNA-binding protein
MSERSLRRRLADEGTTYKEVVLDFRMELAASYLRGQEMTIQEVAYLAGYADASNFHRSFSSYYGETPGQLPRHAFGVNANGRKPRRQCHAKGSA